MLFQFTVNKSLYELNERDVTVHEFKCLRTKIPCRWHNKRKFITALLILFSHRKIYYKENNTLEPIVFRHHDDDQLFWWCGITSSQCQYMNDRGGFHHQDAGNHSKPPCKSQSCNKIEGCYHLRDPIGRSSRKKTDSKRSRKDGYGESKKPTSQHDRRA